MIRRRDGARRPDRRALLELQALLSLIAQLREEGGRNRYDVDERHRWVIHRLWIAVGNEADAYAEYVGAPPARPPWSSLRRLRNVLAHVRLPDIDEEEVWEATASRPEALLTLIRELLLRDLPQHP